MSSLRRELSPARTLKWPGHNRVQITCNTSSAYHAQPAVCHLVRRDSSAIKFDRVEIAFILSLLYWLKPLADEKSISNLDLRQLHFRPRLPYHAVKVSPCLTQPTRPTSPSTADPHPPIPGAWRCSHWSRVDHEAGQERARSKARFTAPWCISGTDLLRQVDVLPHCEKSCRSNSLPHPVTV